MRTWDINTYKARLLGALQAYEHKALKRGGLHPQRVQDVRILRDCIHSMYDTALLDSELQLYLSKMFIRRSWSAYFWGQSAQSELKRMLEVVMADEQVQTWQLEQLMSDYQLCQHMLAGRSMGDGQDGILGKYSPSQSGNGATRGREKKNIKAITWDGSI